MADATARPFVETPDWRARYNSDAVETWAGTAAALESLYQQVHKLRDALAEFVGPEWARQQSSTDAYKWHSGAGVAKPAEDPVARAIAWLEWLRRTRNRVVQHRIERGVRLHGFVVTDAYFAAVHTPRGSIDVAPATTLVRSAKYWFNVDLQASGEAGDVASVVGLSENLYCLGRLGMSDKLRRVAMASKVDVLMGSRYVVEHLDSAVTTIVQHRYPAGSR